MTGSSVGASVSTLKHRQTRQQRLLHRWEGCRVFFHNHPKQARTRIGRAELRKAAVWIRVLRRELGETRAALEPRRVLAAGSSWLWQAFVCIHRYEGAWDANTGNGYYGGLQMDIGFQSRYGGDFLDRWGTADHWPAWAQIQAAAVAYRSGRGFWPWPNTARACGLL